MPTACAPTDGPGGLEGGQRRLAVARARPRGPGPAAPPAAPDRRARSAPGTRTSSRITSAVWLARMPILRNFGPHRQARPCRGGTTKDAWPRAPSAGSTVATTTWTSAMPPLVIQVLVPFSTHSSVALVVDGPGPQRRHVASRRRARSRRRRRAARRPRVPKHCGQPLPHLLGRALAHDADRAEHRAHDRQADAGVAPEQLLEERAGWSGRSGRRRRWP